MLIIAGLKLVKSKQTTGPSRASSRRPEQEKAKLTPTQGKTVSRPSGCIICTSAPRSANLLLHLSLRSTIHTTASRSLLSRVFDCLVLCHDITPIRRFLDPRLHEYNTFPPVTPRYRSCFIPHHGFLRQRRHEPRKFST